MDGPSSAQRFITRFKLIAYCTIFAGGIYLPVDGIKCFGKKINWILIYCIVFNIFLGFNAVDLTLIGIIMARRDGVIEALFPLSFSLIYVWSNLNNVSFMFRHNELRHFMDLWMNLKPPVAEKERDKNIKDGYRLVILRMWFIIIIFNMRFLFFIFYNTSIGVLMSPSMFAYSDESMDAPRLAVASQTIALAILVLGFSYQEVLLSLFQRLVVAELDYLKTTMDSIMTITDEAIIEDIHFTSDSSRKFYNVKHDLMKKWIYYHSKVFEFTTQMKRVYSPLITLQSLFLWTMMSGCAYGMILTDIPKMISVSTTITFSILLLMALQSTRLADQIRDKSVQLLDSTTCNNWVFFPMPLKKTFLNILTVIKYRPVFIIYREVLCAYDSNNFADLCMIQWKLLLFLKDMADK